MLSSDSGISSVAHQLSFFGVGFSLCWFIGSLFLCLAPFLGQAQWSVSWPPAVRVLWWFDDYLSILQCHLTLDIAHWLRRWTFWTTTCLISGSSLSPAHCWPFCLSNLCLLEVCISPFPLLLCTFSKSIPLVCDSFQFLVYCSFFFFAQVGVSLPRCLCWFTLGVAGGKPRDAWCSPVGLLNVS
jgi:hypothetical protein